ncbi:MAG: hypothetical protein GXY33_09565 [Phycisphaerae bacterium]|nr:hypothetical protein [Phycisphaerae bacterium]
MVRIAVLVCVLWTLGFAGEAVAAATAPVEEMIGDSGFEGTLNADHWYFAQDGTDWDGFKAWKETSEAAADDRIKTEGKRSLRMTGPATVVSKAFPYNGEKLILSGWIRTQDIKGSGWCGAGIQFVGLDADGKHFCHHDLWIGFGTNDWRHHRAEHSFPAAVKKVQVWIRIFDTATGTAWFDDVRLQRIPIGTVRPFDPTQATVTIDAGKPGEPIRHRVWAGVDAAFACWLVRPDVQEMLPWLQRAGFEMIRIHEISNGLEIYPCDDDSGNPVYNWERFDLVFDALLKHGLRPNITLETTPQALDRPGTKRPNFQNTDPPRDMAQWGRYVEAIFDHAVGRYGKDEVQKWFWEIWNEPCFPSGYYTGTRDELVEIMDRCYLAAERIEEKYDMNLMMGLTSSGDRSGEEAFLKRLSQMGRLGQVDHYSQHYYAGGSSSLRMFQEAIPALWDFEKQFSGLKFKQVGCTEWNCNSRQSPLFDMPWNASFAVKTVRIMLDEGLDYATYFGLVDHPEIPLPPPLFVPGGAMGMFTRFANPVPKPVYNAFVFLNELKGGRRLGFESSNDPIDGLAVVMPDGSVRIILANFDEDTSRQPYQTKVTVAVGGLDGGDYRCTRHWAADETHGNTCGKWAEMGKPNVDDEKAKLQVAEEIKNIAIEPATVVRENGEVTLVLDVPSPGIRFVELRETPK